jgi:hypothetical protein
MADIQQSLNTIQAGTAAISKDLEAIAEHQQRLAQALKQLAVKGTAAKNELEDLSNQAEAVAKDVIYTAQQAQQVAHPPQAGQGLPSGGAHPGHDLPSGARPDHGLPGQGQIDNALPGQPGHISGQPVPPGKPGGGERPDAGLPPTGQPKK